MRLQTPRPVSARPHQRPPRPLRPARSAAPLAALLLAACLADGSAGSAEPPAAAADTAALPYRPAAEEGPGAAVVVLVDNSGSMAARVPGGEQRKHAVARRALREVLAATDSVVARRPGFPVRVAIHRFSGAVHPVFPLAPYDRAAVAAALARMPPPEDSTAIGEALLHAVGDLYRAGTLRKYVLVVTDGENTVGRAPDEVAREIHRRSGGAVQMHFVAFDTDPAKFAFLEELGGSVLAAGGGAELRRALDEIYRGKILAEKEDPVEAGEGR